MPNEKEIQELARELDTQASAQAKLDMVADDLLLRQGPLQVGAPAHAKVRRISTGIAELLVSQRFDLHSTTPRITANSPDKTMDKNKEEIEAGIAGCWMLAPGEVDVWLDQVWDVDTIGRGWSFICYDPSKWGSKEFYPYETDDPKEVEEDKKRRYDLKASRFPIIWRYVDPRCIRWTKGERGQPDQVIEKLTMTAREARRAYGIDTDRAGDRDTIEILRYGDDQYVCTVAVVGKNPVIAKEQWEHGMGINPYLLARGRRRAPGDLFHGPLYHPQDLIQASDAMLSDAHYNAQLATRAAIIAETDVDAPVDAEGGSVPVKLQPETITALPPGVSLKTLDAPRTNVDVMNLQGLYQGLIFQNNISNALRGITQSGQSGALFNSSVAIAQRAHTPDGSLLERAAVGAAQRFLAAICAMGDDVPIRFSANQKAYNVTLNENKVKGWERELQATIEFGVPFNQNAQAELARLVTQGTPDNPALVNRQTAMEQYLNIANPADNERRIRIDMLTSMLLEPAFQIAVANFMRNATDVPSGLEEEVGALPPAVQQAIMVRRQRSAQQTGQNGGGQVARSAANSLREGVAPQPYDIGAPGAV